MTCTTLREKAMVNHYAFEEMSNESKKLKADFEQLSGELKERDEQMMTKTTELIKEEDEITTLKDKTLTDDATIKSLNEAFAAAQEALKKAEQDKVIMTIYLQSSCEALTSTEAMDVQKYKSSTDYVDYVSFFLDGYEELKKRVMTHYPNIADEVRKWQGDDEEATALADEDGDDAPIDNPLAAQTAPGFVDLNSPAV